MEWQVKESLVQKEFAQYRDAMSQSSAEMCRKMADLEESLKEQSTRMRQLTTTLYDFQHEVEALRNIVEKQLWGYIKVQEPGDPPPINPPYPTFVVYQVAPPPPPAAPITQPPAIDPSPERSADRSRSRASSSEAGGWPEDTPNLAEELAESRREKELADDKKRLEHSKTFWDHGR